MSGENRMENNIIHISPKTSISSEEKNAACSLVTVIVPVYNVEKYLSRCVDSIINQSYKNLEIILVDDGSTDSSGAICDEYANKDSRVKVIHKENNGVSSARNTGLDSANGVYIAFVDADDYIELDLVTKAYRSITDSGADLLKFGVYEEYYAVTGQLVTSKPFSPNNFLVDNKESIKAKAVELELVPLFGYMCNSFYRNCKMSYTRLNHKIKVNEDFDFNIRYINNISCMQGIDYCGYHYAKRENESVSTSINPTYYRDHMRKITGFLEIYEGVSNMPKVVRSNVFWLYTRFIYSAVARADVKCRTSVIKTVIRDDIYKLFRETEFSNLSVKQKLMIFFLKIDSPIIINILVCLIVMIKRYLPEIFLQVKR